MHQRRRLLLWYLLPPADPVLYKYTRRPRRPFRPVWASGQGGGRRHRAPLASGPASIASASLLVVVRSTPSIDPGIATRGFGAPRPRPSDPDSPRPGAHRGAPSSGPAAMAKGKEHWRPHAHPTGYFFPSGHLFFIPPPIPWLSGLIGT